MNPFCKAFCYWKSCLIAKSWSLDNLVPACISNTVPPLHPRAQPGPLQQAGTMHPNLTQEPVLGIQKRAILLSKKDCLRASHQIFSRLLSGKVGKVTEMRVVLWQMDFSDSKRFAGDQEIQGDICVSKRVHSLGVGKTDFYSVHLPNPLMTSLFRCLSLFW